MENTTVTTEALEESSCGMTTTEAMIETTLSNWDPFDLVIFPGQKEYDIEAKTIAEKITEIETHQEVMDSSFGLSIDLEKCRFAAELFWERFSDVVAVS